MKLIVFFFFAFIMLMFQTVLFADSPYTVSYNHDLEERRIQVTHQDEPETTYYLGDGTKPMMFGAHYYAGDYYIVTGEAHYRENNHMISEPYLLILDANNDVHMKLVYDDYDYSVVQKVFALEDTLIVQREVPKEENNLSNTKTKFYFYKQNELFETHIFDQPLYISEQESEYLFLKKSGIEGYGLAFDQEAEKYTASDFKIESKTYQGPLELTLFNEALLNDERIDKGVHTIEYPGYYTLKTPPEETDFIIEPKIEGLKDSKTYYESLSISYDYGQLFLNDEVYASGDKIDQIGNHKLKVIGLNDYEKTFEFTIKNDLEAFEKDLKTTPLIVNLMGDMKLNDQEIESGYVIDSGGTYRLELHGIDDFKQTIEFDLLTDEVTMKEQLLSLEIGIIATLIMLGSITLFGLYKKRFKKA